VWTFCGMGQICCSHEALHQPTSHFWKRRNNARCKPRGFDTIRTMFGVVTHDPFALGGLYIALPRSFSWSLLEVGTSTRTLRRWSLGGGRFSKRKPAGDGSVLTKPGRKPSPARERTLSCGTECYNSESRILPSANPGFHDFATSIILPVSSPIFRSMDSILLFTAAEIASSPSMSLLVSTCTLLAS